MLDTFIGPVVRSLQVVHDDPKGLLSEICKALAQYPEWRLARAAERLTAERKKLVSKKDALDAVKAVPPQEQVRLTPDRPSWPAWIEHHRAGGARGRSYADFLEREGVFLAATECPPGHSRNHAHAA